MTAELPNASDGDALRSLEAIGSDLSREMEIDFFVVPPDEDRGRAFSAAAEYLGFRTKLVWDDKFRSWTCNCTKSMIPSYAVMIQTQEQLAELGRPYSSFPDGWGTFGNKSESTET